jgi:radical SAM superfamily enzyme YgiQ (UPF0313 family)
MLELALYLRKQKLVVEQVQEFTPTPGTLAASVYYTGIDPFTGEEVYVAKSDREKRMQKALLLSHLPEERKRVMEALRLIGREDAALLLFTPNGGKPAEGRLQPRDKRSVSVRAKRKSKSS